MLYTYTYCHLPRYIIWKLIGNNDISSILLFYFLRIVSIRFRWHRRGERATDEGKQRLWLLIYRFDQETKPIYLSFYFFFFFFYTRQWPMNYILRAINATNYVLDIIILQLKFKPSLDIRDKFYFLFYFSLYSGQTQISVRV
jgi:hypothetical protein